MYYFPEPPYFLIAAGFFVAITCGAAFEAMLKQKVKPWLKKPDGKLKDLNLQLPFLGMFIGICLFLASGLEIFLLSPWPAYAIALPLTIFIAALVWTQLEKVLQQLKVGGSKALDLDIF